MLTHFDTATLRELFKDFYHITQIRITLFDNQFNEIVSYPEELPEYCRLIRQTQAGRQKCLKCDRIACQTAAKHKNPYVYQCHIGLTEAITPVRPGNTNIGYLMFGHINNGASAKFDSPLMIAAFEQLKKADNEYIYSASKIMETVASYLSLRRIAALKIDSLSAHIDRYISNHLSESLSSDLLCEKFHISRTSLYNLSMEVYGMGIMEQIKKQRMELARTLLLETDRSIAEIATACGISNYNYFTKVFRNEFKLTPRDYRKTTK